MLRKIEPLSFLLRRNAQTDGLIHKSQDGESSNDTERPSDRYADELIQELVRISLNEAGGQNISIRIFQDWIDGADGEDSRKDRADCPARPMDAERIERIVIPKARLYLCDHEVTCHTRNESDGHRRHGLYESGRRGYRNEPGHGSGNGTQGARFPATLPLNQGPPRSRCCSREMRRNKSTRSQAARGKRAACVETKPAHPKQACPDKAQNHAVRRHGLIRIPQSFAKVERTDQSRHSRGYVYNSPAGKI